MNDSQPGRSTVAVHGPLGRHHPNEPVVQPVFQSTTYVAEVGAEREVLYERYGNTPNQLAVARKYALLEGAEAAVFVASGMAATAMAHLAVLRPGDRLVASRWIYGGTRRLFDEEFGRFGISVTYVDPDQPRAWRKALTRNTRAVFFESPVNPTMRVVDPKTVVQICREQGVALLVDSTFASPINFRPIEHGADVVITSGTKYLNGHSDVTAGVVAGTQSVIDEVTRLARLWGSTLNSHSAWLLDRGMKTLELRVERQNANGLAIAQWASQHPAIAAVHYPGLPSHPDHELASRLLSGFGGMVGLVIKGGPEAAERFLRRLEIVAHAPSLAGVESLVSEPRLTSHKGMSAEARAAMGIPDGYVRLSAGIENAADLIADLRHALDGV
ncbi:MAG: aminotransferase class I/II-fold pyridoxal phosphate-dependent enzyme [Gemmatimonadetes bacterium]|nr:aminotransferase class I/II-fold pyridoxal phosphate-dependent enzyme [Gemmatimonadota bacterium]